MAPGSGPNFSRVEGCLFVSSGERYTLLLNGLFPRRNNPLLLNGLFPRRNNLGVTIGLSFWTKM